MHVADWIRAVLVQYAGGSVVKADEEIIRIDLTTGPHYFGQDTQERTLAALTVEVWHRTGAREGVGADADLLPADFIGVSGSGCGFRVFN